MIMPKLEQDSDQEEAAWLYTFWFIISVLGTATIAPFVVIYATVAMYGLCTDTGGCRDGATTLGDQLVVILSVAAIAIVSLGVTTALGKRAFPNKLWAVRLLAIASVFWVPVLLGLYR